MRVHDLRVLGVAVLVFLVALKVAPGRTVFVETWTLRAAAAWGGGAALATDLWLPAPLVTDLNGDGYAEVVAVTHLPQPRLVVANADPRVARRPGVMGAWGDGAAGAPAAQGDGDAGVRRFFVKGAGGVGLPPAAASSGGFLYGRGIENRFRSAFLIGERDLVARAPGRSTNPEGDKERAWRRRPLALAAGWIADPGARRRGGGWRVAAGGATRQVVALVTADWTVVVVDAALRLVWESRAVAEALVGDDGAEPSAPTQLAVYVSPEAGVVLVGSVGDARARIFGLGSDDGKLAWSGGGPDAVPPPPSCMAYKADVMRGGLPHRWASSDDTRLSAISLDLDAGRTAQPSSSSPAASVLVAHVKEGLLVVRADTGATVCEMALPDSRGATTLHADVDGDGVVNHVSVLDGARAEDLKTMLAEVVPGTELMQPCYVVNTAGTDTSVRQAHLWSTAGACRSVPGISGRSLSSTAQRRKAREALALLSLEFATPAFLRDAPRLNAWGVDETRPDAPSRGDVITLNNRGDVARISGRDGKSAWIQRTRAGWSAGHSLLPGVKIPWVRAATASTPRGSGAASSSEVVIQHPVYPSVEPFAPRTFGDATHVLVVGEKNGVVLGPRGNDVGTFVIPGPPTSRATVADLNGDGLSDVVVHTHGAYFAYRQELRWGVVAWLGVIWLVVAFAYVLHEQAGLKPGDHDVDVLKVVKDILGPVEAYGAGLRSRDGVVRASSSLIGQLALRSRRREVLPVASVRGL